MAEPMEMTETKSRKKTLFIVMAIVVLLAGVFVFTKARYLFPAKISKEAACKDDKGKNVKCTMLLVTFKTDLPVAEKNALEESIVKLGAGVTQFEYADTMVVTRDTKSTGELRKWHDELIALQNVTKVEYDANNVQDSGS
jgi:hypothetical protein